MWHCRFIAILVPMKRILTIAISLIITLLGFAKQPPKHEVRAAWITANYGLDWPTTRATNASTIEKQKRELIELLDQLKAAKFNTVLFQARTRGDVLYASAIEPYNAILTGKNGKSPGYDPLAFAIEECHKRGMECHAWMVAIPLGGRRHVTSLGKNSVVKKKPSICVSYKREYFLNPGHPETKKYLMSLVSEVVKNYDVDGVHFDYLRYPEHATNFPDAQSFRKYRKGRSLSQWRKDNLTEIVRYLYQGVKALKPWVKVSTSPVGKYDDTTRYSSKGWNAYDAVHQDVQGWMAEGIQDQIYPMMYYQGNSFYPFALDWEEQSYGRHVVPGLGIYFLDPSEGDWPIEEIERQINFTREHGLEGQAYYRMKFLSNNVQGLYNKLQYDYYQSPALIPPMTWLDSIPPTTPTELEVKKANGYITLSWKAATDNDTKNAPRYVVYASNSYPVDTSNPENILAQQLTDCTFTYAPMFPWEEKLYYKVTAIDRYGNESY